MFALLSFLVMTLQVENEALTGIAVVLILRCLCLLLFITQANYMAELYIDTNYKEI